MQAVDCMISVWTLPIAEHAGLEGPGRFISRLNTSAVITSASVSGT